MTIDTIRFKIPLDVITYQTIEASGIPSMSKKDRLGYKQDSLSDRISLDDLQGGFQFYVLKKNVEWTLFLEFSAPKVYYGHNLFLLYPDLLPEILLKIMNGLNERFSINLPAFETWILQRVDLCTVWKLPTDEIALAYLQSIRAYEYPRKGTVVHETTLTGVGTSGSVKFYLKHPEFLVHSYKEKAYFNPTLAASLAEYSIGCLRFEVELKKSKLKSVFQLAKGEVLHLSDILNEDILRRILDKELRIWLKGLNRTVMDDFLIMEKLKETYGQKKALELFKFYYVYCDSAHSKTILKQSLDKSTINRNLSQIASAGVGLRGKLTLPYELSIFSPLNPNPDNQHLPNLPNTSNELLEKQLSLPLPRPTTFE